MNKMVLLIGLFLLPLAPAQGEDSLISAENAWARATPPGSRSAAVYLTLINNSVKDMAVTGISTEIAKKASIHETRSHDGMMHMEKMGSFSLKAGENRLLEPGGVHIMLMGLQEDLVEGSTFDVLVNFEKFFVEVPVKVVSMTQVSAP